MSSTRSKEASSLADCFNLSEAFITSASQFVRAVIISRVIVCSRTPIIIPHQIPWKKKKPNIYPHHLVGEREREGERSGSSWVSHSPVSSSFRYSCANLVPAQMIGVWNDSSHRPHSGDSLWKISKSDSSMNKSHSCKKKMDGEGRNGLSTGYFFICTSVTFSCIKSDQAEFWHGDSSWEV